MNKIDTEILDLLRCPVTGTKLHYAEIQVVDQINRCVQAGQLADRSGQQIDFRIDAGLVNADNSLLMPIRVGVVSMAANRSIEIEQLGNPESDAI